MVEKIRRQRWVSTGDALNLMVDLKNKNATVAHDIAPDDVLRTIIWASPEQILLAKTYGGVVIQDNTCLTNRCGETTREFSYHFHGGGKFDRAGLCCDERCPV